MWAYAIYCPAGRLIFVSEPVTGHNHDMTALAETETA